MPILSFKEMPLPTRMLLCTSSSLIWTSGRSMAVLILLTDPGPEASTNGCAWWNTKYGAGAGAKLERAGHAVGTLCQGYVPVSLATYHALGKLSTATKTAGQSNTPLRAYPKNWWQC